MRRDDSVSDEATLAMEIAEITGKWPEIMSKIRPYLRLNAKEPQQPVKLLDVDIESGAKVLFRADNADEDATEEKWQICRKAYIAIMRDVLAACGVEPHRKNTP